MPAGSEAKTETKKVPAEALRFDAGNWTFAEPAAEGSKNVPISIVARTGKPIDHWYWGKVVHDMAGLRLHKKAIPVDYAHQDDEVLGYLDRFETDSGDLVVGGEVIPFTPEDRASEVIHKSRNKVPYEASIYFSGPLRIEELEAGATAQVNGYTLEGPAVIFRQWSLRGVAVCPYGYDRNTKTKLKAGDPSEVPVEFSKKERSPMPEPQTPPEELTAAKPEEKPAEQPAGELAAKPEEKPAEKPAGELAAKPEEKPAEKPAELADPRAEAKKFIDAFGADGATWFAEGKTFEQAQQAQGAKLAAENDELKKKLAAAQLGEGEPLSFGDGEAGGKAGKKTGDNYGTALSALVAHNAAVIGGPKR